MLNESNEDGRLCACNNTNVDYTKECPSPLFNGFTSVNISAEEIDAIVVDVPIEDESSDISNGTEQGGPPKQNIIVAEEKKGSDDFSNDVEGQQVGYRLSGWSDRVFSDCGWCTCGCCVQALRKKGRGCSVLEF